MKGYTSRILIGVLFVAAAVSMGANVLGYDYIGNYFKGWWTLIIIVPCVISILKSGFTFINLFGLGAGVIFLLDAWKVIPNNLGAKLLFPLILLVIGIKLLVKGNKPCVDKVPVLKNICKGSDTFSAFFSGTSPSFNGAEFFGCTTNAVFGGVELDLKNAVINNDCKIECNTFFGGTEIKLPPNVKLVVSGNPIFGGMDNRFVSSQAENAPTVYISSTCVFGGVDIY